MRIKTTVIRMINQSIAILIISLFISLSLNYMRSDSLPLLRQSSPEQLTSMDAVVLDVLSLDEAKNILKNGEAVFVDARSDEEYRSGHLPGAYNLFAETFEKQGKDTGHALDSGRLIVVYAASEESELAFELAPLLKTRGYENIKIFLGGVSAWKEAGLALESGPER